MGKVILGMIIILVIFFLGTIDEGVCTDDFYYMKACYPWFRPPETRNNCTLRCNLNMPYLGISHEEVAICLSDGMTGITCHSDTDCQQILQGSYCKRAFCLCEEKGLDRFYVLGASPDTSINFCTASSQIHSIHLPLVLFPWKTLMIVFGTLVFTGLLLMTLKWLTPIISALREIRIPENHSRRSELLNPEPRPVAQDKPPSYETAVQLGDVLPSYEDAQRLPSVSLNVNGQTDPTIPTPERPTLREGTSSNNDSRQPLLEAPAENANIIGNCSSGTVQAHSSQ